MLDRVLNAYTEAIYDTDRDRAFQVVHDALAEGVSPEDIVFEIVSPSLEMMVKAISESDTANLAQHFLASQIGADITEEMMARFRQAPRMAGSVVIGTSQGDFHGLGKRIVAGCLKAAVIEVIDLGTNVPPERFVDEAVSRDAQVIAVSSMMVHTARSESGCLGVRRILRERRLEDRIKVVVGGAPYRFDPELYRIVQADAWAANGIAAGEIIARLIEEVQS
ncbi:MAG: cobalamin-dependent protein [Candidatus Hydrogenedentes bacterium]|nr:cobalamin-dependent protein [Candidatus Hydrogenedentota bacterium]